MASMHCTITTCVVLFIAAGLSCNGQKFHIKHAPPYIVLQSQSSGAAVKSSDIHNVLSVPLGLSNEHNSLIQSKTVLKRPKANVLFTVVTHKDKDLPVDSKASFAVHWEDIPYVDIEQLMNNLQSKFLDTDPVMLDMLSSNQYFDIKTSSPLFQSLQSSFDYIHGRFLDPDSSFLTHLAQFSGKTALNSSVASDRELLAELQMVHDIISTLRSKPNHLDTKVPDLLSFTLSGLQSVGKEHGVDSEQAKDAQEIVTQHLNQITEELKSLYKGNVMVEVLTVPHVDVAKVRKTRSLMSENSVNPPDAAKLNLELDWYADFPVTFHIVLWLMVILVITVFFVAYGIWNMNPNLESILYRVPQDDLKKMN
jgi:renin receptor